VNPKHWLRHCSVLQETTAWLKYDANFVLLKQAQKLFPRQAPIRTYTYILGKNEKTIFQKKA